MFERNQGIRFNKKGLVPAIIQDATSQEVLIMVYMDKKAVKKTMQTSELWLYNRSVKKIWQKGQHTGNTMTVKSIRVHHNKNALLVQVIPHGPPCHTGNSTCFYKTYWDGEKLGKEVDEETAGMEQTVSDVMEVKEVDEEMAISQEEYKSESEITGEVRSQQEDILNQVYQLIHERRVNSVAGSYTSQLFQLGREEIAKKLGAEAVTLALKSLQNQSLKVVCKSADLLYHWLVLLVDQGISLQEVLQELRQRRQ